MVRPEPCQVAPPGLSNVSWPLPLAPKCLMTNMLAFNFTNLQVKLSFLLPPLCQASWSRLQVEGWMYLSILGLNTFNAILHSSLLCLHFLTTWRHAKCMPTHPPTLDSSKRAEPGSYRAFNKYPFYQHMLALGPLIFMICCGSQYYSAKKTRVSSTTPNFNLKNKLSAILSA